MDRIIERIAKLSTRKHRFTYDLRSDCVVYNGGVVSAYRATQDSDHFLDVPQVVAHAMAHDGIVGGWTDPGDGKVYFDSCRLFTDVGQALRFAERQQQRSVFNLNRQQELMVKAQRHPMNNNTIANGKEER